MKKWSVFATEEAQDDLDNFVYFLLVEKLNEQAAKAVLEDEFDKLLKEFVKTHDGRQIEQVFSSFISDEISKFDTDLYYQNPDHIKESYLAGELLE